MKMKTNLLFLMLLSVYLGIHNGNLAIIDAQTEAPVEVFPYSVKLYTKCDQSALTEGIPIDNKYDYQKALEDFLS